MDKSAISLARRHHQDLAGGLAPIMTEYAAENTTLGNPKLVDVVSQNCPKIEDLSQAGDF